MRIIAGLAKGREIKTPKGSGTRPALAKVREAIFSSLGPVTDLVFMDIFAGSGSLGLEALSRQAKFVYFIEDGSEALRCIIENLKNFGFAAKAKIFKRTLPAGLKKMELQHKLDVIFCDPPYDRKLVNTTLAGLIERGFVSDETLILVEHTRREMPSVAALTLVKEKQYGQTLISYLRLSC